MISMNSLNLISIIVFNIGYYSSKYTGVPYDAITFEPAPYTGIINHLRSLVGNTYQIEYVYNTTIANRLIGLVSLTLSRLVFFLLPVA